MDERMDGVERDQREMRNTLSEHGALLAGLGANMTAMQSSLRENTEALKAHAKVLNEYSGARKAIHWLVTAGTAFAAYFFGSQGKG